MELNEVPMWRTLGTRPSDGMFFMPIDLTKGSFWRHLECEKRSVWCWDPYKWKIGPQLGVTSHTMQVQALVRAETRASFGDGKFTVDTQVAPFARGVSFTFSGVGLDGRMKPSL